MVTIHKSYNDVTLKDTLVDQGFVVQTVFPQTFTQEMYELWQDNPKVLQPGCGCTSFIISPERNEIVFKVQAPSFTNNLSEPYLKHVTPKFFYPDGRQVHWDIKFYVNPKK